MAQRHSVRGGGLGRRRSRRAIGALVLLGLVASGCGVVKDVHRIDVALKGNKATIDNFTTTIKSTPTTPFEATYATTGSSPATVVYAVDPPKQLAFKDTPSGGSDADVIGDLVVTKSGEYACSHATSGWSCDKLSALSAADQNNVFDFYTPSHWINFLKGFSLVAGLAGDKVSTSTMSVNGFSMHCVDFVVSGEPGTSTICTTSQGLLGYVKVATDSTSFEITSYTSSPPASLFELPPGAKVTTVTTPTTS